MTLMGYCEQARVNLLAAKLRTLLAVLGIFIGTAAVVALLSCGRLATEKALEQFKALGTDLLAISLYSKEPAAGQQLDTAISPERWRQLPDFIPDFVQVAPYATTYQPISFQGKLLEGVVVGADESLASILQFELAAGHFLSFLESFEHFCVIGDGVAQQLKQISLDAPLGRQIRIGQSLYTIIGVLKPWQENAFFNENVNQTIMIPLAGISLVDQHAKLHNAIFRLKPKANIEQVTRQINQFFSKNMPKLSVFIRSAKQVIASMESQGRVFSSLLAVIGSISLLVGGIGVMNVMLVSVSERKKEIGLRKALGATKREIQRLFLIESVMLALLGGILGIVFGLLFTWGVAWFNQWPFSIYLFPLFVSFFISVATGVFFGFYPARRAALLEPVESLREGL